MLGPTPSSGRDQDGARRRCPDVHDASEWLNMMKPGDVLLFVHRDGGHRQINHESDGSQRVSQVDGAGRTILERPALDARQVQAAFRQYFEGMTDSQKVLTWQPSFD